MFAPYSSKPTLRFKLISLHKNIATANGKTMSLDCKAASLHLIELAPQ